MSRIQRDTPIKKTKQDLFLEEFAKHGNITLACRKAEIGRMTLYRWKEKSDTFLVRFNQAFEEAKDAIRAEIYRRGKEGWDDGVVHKYSDTLLIFHAKMLMPEYREKQQVEMSGPDGTPMQVQHTYDFSVLSDDEFEQLKLLAAKARGG